MKSLHLLRPGTFTDMSGKRVKLAAEHIADIANNYDPKLHEAPLVIGHPKTDDPAYGWIGSVTSDESGLHGAPIQVDPEFAEMVRDGKYKKLSVALYGPKHPNNPTPEHWNLRHVGFLGATPPVVKGLRSVAFGEGDAPDITLEV